MKRLKELREENGLTQGQLAKMAGVSRATIARAEAKPEYVPREATIDKLAEALGVFSVELFADDEFSFPFSPEDFVEMSGEQTAQLLFSLMQGGRLSLKDAAEQMKWTALRRGGNARRLPEGERREEAIKKTLQAVYFWGYLDGHNDQQHWGALLEEAQAKDQEEEKKRAE